MIGFFCYTLISLSNWIDCSQSYPRNMDKKTCLLLWSPVMNLQICMAGTLMPLHEHLDKFMTIFIISWNNNKANSLRISNLKNYQQKNLF